MTLLETHVSDIRLFVTCSTTAHNSCQRRTEAALLKKLPAGNSSYRD